MAEAATAASEDGTDDSLMSGVAKWDERGAATGTERNAMMGNGIGSKTEQKKGTEMRNRTHREIHPSTELHSFLS